MGSGDPQGLRCPPVLAKTTSPLTGVTQALGVARLGLNLLVLCAVRIIPCVVQRRSTAERQTTSLGLCCLLQAPLQGGAGDPGAPTPGEGNPTPTAACPQGALTRYGYILSHSLGNLCEKIN